MAKYMDSGGLSHFMGKIKSWAAEAFAPKSHTHDYTKTRVKGNAESSYRTGDVNLTPANIGAVALSGNETVAGNKTFTGNTVIESGSTVRLPDNTKVINANSAAIIQSPIPKYLWHDLFSFCRYDTPDFYTSTDNTTWTAAMLDAKSFAQLENIIVNALTATVTGARWVWNSSAFAYSGASWLVIGICYTYPIATYTIHFEGSTDGETWTTLHQSTNTYNQQPIWCYVTNLSNRSHLRLTITKELNDTGTLNVNAIKLLTTRWGNQGAGSEFEYPYNWDATPNIVPIANNTSSLGSGSRKWKEVVATKFSGDVTGGIQPATFRPTSANTTGYGAYLRYFLATSSMTTGKPDGDGHVLDMEWDNNGKWHGQLFVPTDATKHVQWRAENGGTWTAWRKLFDDRDVIPVANGGTGQTTAINAANALINALSTGNSDPTDADYYISQYVGGGTTTTTYHRRPMSALWNYIKGKFKATMLSSATDSSSEELAATPKAVKAAYDLANSASNTAGQAMSAATGSLVFKVTYSVSGSTVTCAAHVYSAGQEVTSNHADSCFVWSMSLNGGSSWTSLGTGKTKDVTAMTAFGGNVKCDFTPAS